MNTPSEAAKNDLTEKGYSVVSGLTKEYAKDIIEMALEPHIKLTCPNDSGSRFTNVTTTKQWLKKNGGRGVFLLVRNKDKQLAGYGWTGAGTSQHVPEGKITFAIRIGEIGLKQGLATPFSQLIIQGSAVLFGAKDFWLETWKSNEAAVHIYTNVGFKPVTEVKSGDDTRVFMMLPNELLP